MPALLVGLLLALGAPVSEVKPRAINDVIAHAIKTDSAQQLRLRFVANAGAGAPDAVYALGTIARLTYHYPEARQWYGRLVQPGRAPRNVWEVYALLGLGLEALARWQQDDAAFLLAAAAQAADSLAAPAAESEALIALSQLVSRTVGFDSASALLRRAERLIPDDATDLAITARCSRATLLRLREPARADTLVRSALAAAERRGNPRVTGRCHFALVQVLEARGRVAEAWRSIPDARKSLTAARDWHALASVLQFNAYIIVQYVGNFSAGQQQAEAAIFRARQSGNVAVMPWAQLNLAQLALRVGDTPTALRQATAAEIGFTANGDRAGLAARDMVFGDASYLSGHLSDARSAFESAIRRYDALGFVAFRIAGMLRLASLSIDAGDGAAASATVDSATALATRRGMVGVVATDQHYLRGRLAMLAHDYQSAIPEFQAYEKSVGPNAYHLRFDADLRIAECLALAGRLDDAEAMFDRGSLRLETWRGYMEDRATRLSLVQGRRNDFDVDLGVATIVSAFTAAGRTSAAFRITELERARHLSTVLERRQIVASDSLPAAASRTARLVLSPLELDSIRRAMPARTALLEFVTGHGREPTTVFVVSRDTVRVARAGSIDSLTDEITRLGDALGAGLPATALAKSIGDRLLGALSVLPPDIDRLVIVPDGALYRVPFDALRMQSGQLLGERFATSVSPSARIALEWWHAPKSIASGPRVLVYADPPVHDRHAALPFARAEARGIRTLLPGTVLRLGADATERDLKLTDWSRFSVVHFATHADVDEQSMTSGTLILGAGSGDDGRVTAAEVVRLPLSGQLIVLSGCRTSGGTVLNGEGMQGLTTSFLEAGARTVLATQWAIGDRSIVPMVDAIYAGLRAGHSVAAAVRDARMQLMRKGASPAVWAAFTVIGDGDQRLFKR